MSSGGPGTAEDEFRAFVASTQTRLLRVALGLTLDRGLAEDLVQTAYLRTYARWGRLRDQDPAAYVTLDLRSEDGTTGQTVISPLDGYDVGYGMPYDGWVSATIGWACDRS